MSYLFPSIPEKKEVKIIMTNRIITDKTVLERLNSLIMESSFSCSYFQNKTGMPYYDDCMSNPDYFRKNKKVTCQIVEMTPVEYFRESARMHNLTYNQEIDRLDPSNVEAIMQKMKEGTKYYMPVLDYIYNSQEGAHRVWAVKQLGCQKVPVLVVKLV